MRICHPFAARGLLMSAQDCLVFVLGSQSWRVDSQGDKSKLRSIEIKVRGPTLPATRSNHQVGYSDNHVQCSKLPVANSPLATNFSRWRPPTCDLVAKKRKKNSRRCDSFAKEGGRIGKLAGALFLPFFRFASIEYETRIAKLPHACEVQPVESCVAGAFHACCRKIENKKTK